MSKALQDGEVLQALVHVNSGSGGGAGSGMAQAHATKLSPAGYVAEHGIAEKGLNGQFALADIWLALTDRRLLVWSGSVISLAPRPKKLLTEAPRDSFTVTWRDARSFTGYRLYHFVFPDEQHLVRLGEDDDEADRFVAALGDQASLMPEPD